MDNNTALMVIDVQTGMFDYNPPLFKGADLLAAIKTLISQARASNKVTLGRDAHSTWDTEYLKAAQIIAHHNQVLSDWFVTLKTAAEIQFGAHRSGMGG